MSLIGAVEIFFVDSGRILEDFTDFSQDFNPPGDEIAISLERKASKEDIISTMTDKMPGFKLTWNYTGEIDLGGNQYEFYYYDEVTYQDYYVNYSHKFEEEDVTRSFVRHRSAVAILLLFLLTLSILCFMLL